MCGSELIDWYMHTWSVLYYLDLSFVFLEKWEWGRYWDVFLGACRWSFFFFPFHWLNSLIIQLHRNGLMIECLERMGQPWETRNLENETVCRSVGRWREDFFFLFLFSVIDYSSQYIYFVFIRLTYHLPFLSFPFHSFYFFIDFFIYKGYPSFPIPKIYIWISVYISYISNIHIQYPYPINILLFWDYIYIIYKNLFCKFWQVNKIIFIFRNWYHIEVLITVGLLISINIC